MTIRDLHDEHEKEFADAALTVLVDQAMGEWPFPRGGLGDTEDGMRAALAEVFNARLSPERMIKWAARISEDVMTFEAYERRELGD